MFEGYLGWNDLRRHGCSNDYISDYHREDELGSRGKSRTFNFHFDYPIELLNWLM